MARAWDKANLQCRSQAKQPGVGGGSYTHMHTLEFQFDSSMVLRDVIWEKGQEKTHLKCARCQASISYISCIPRPLVRFVGITHIPVSGKSQPNPTALRLAFSPLSYLHQNLDLHYTQIPFDNWRLRIQDKLTHNGDHYPYEVFKVAYIITRLDGEVSKHQGQAEVALRNKTVGEGGGDCRRY